MKYFVVSVLALGILLIGQHQIQNGEFAPLKTPEFGCRIVQCDGYSAPDPIPN